MVVGGKNAGWKGSSFTSLEETIEMITGLIIAVAIAFPRCGRLAARLVPEIANMRSTNEFIRDRKVVRTTIPESFFMTLSALAVWVFCLAPAMAGEYTPIVRHPVSIGTYLMADDGDGWDPDASDPGDWIGTVDTQDSLFADCTVENSSWHGTRAVGIFGPITNNDVGIAGMSSGAWVLPVRALGKCGGYDSDIITAIEWAAGMPVTRTGVSVVPEPSSTAMLVLGAIVVLGVARRRSARSNASRRAWALDSWESTKEHNPYCITRGLLFPEIGPSMQKPVRKH